MANAGDRAGPGEPVDPGKAGSANMVGKALRLLSLLGEHPDGAGVSELARTAGFPVSTTHRLLGSLQREGFATTNPGAGRYRLGLRLFELGQQVSHARGFAGTAVPVMQRVTAHTREATLMSVLDRQQQVYVHCVEGPQQVQITGEPGRRGPVHCTSMGKCLLAFQPDEARRRLLGAVELSRLAPSTIVDRAEFVAEIEQVRERGYAVADEEHEPGIRAVGVPVCGPDGIAIAALSAAAPAYRSTVGELREFVPVLAAAARELAAALPPAPSAR